MQCSAASRALVLALRCPQHVAAMAARGCRERRGGRRVTACCCRRRAATARSEALCGACAAALQQQSRVFFHLGGRAGAASHARRFRGPKRSTTPQCGAHRVTHHYWRPVTRSQQPGRLEGGAGRLDCGRCRRCFSSAVVPSVSVKCWAHGGATSAEPVRPARRTASPRFQAAARAAVG